MNKATVSWIIAIIWFLITFVLFIIPGSEFPTEDWFDRFHMDKLVHIFIFASLVILFCSALRISSPVSFTNYGLILVPLLAIGYGIAIEFIQKNFVENRGFEWMDWVADIAGAIMGAAVVYLLQRRAVKG